MGSLIVGIFLAVVALGVMMLVKVPSNLSRIKNVCATGVMVLGVLIALAGGVAYNQAGYSTHIQTAFGTEDARLTTGWYFAGWGVTTTYPHYITVAHTASVDAQGTSVSAPYTVRMADNWNGTVTQTTRFEIPRSKDSFIKMHQTFRGAESLVSRALRPAVVASLDSTANLFSMEEYYAGGKRDQFKTEYRDAISKGRARVRQVATVRVGGGIVDGNAAPSDQAEAQDTSVQENVQTRRVVMEKITDASGNAIREPHDFMRYDITVSQAILENLDPDDKFEEQIQARKDAASRRIVAQEERREQEEQRLLAIQRGETDIAKRQAAARVEQIQKTTDAETQKKLVLIKAQQQKEEARIAKDTAEINLQKAQIDAEARQVAADAEAYEKRVILEADNALQAKLDAWVRINAEWANAASQINVPETVFSFGGNGEGTNGMTGNLSMVDTFMAITAANQAKQLDVDTSISAE